MTFREKIDIILETNQLDLITIEDIEAKCDIGAKTLRKNYNAGTSPTKRILVKLIKGLDLNPQWWKTGKGEVFNKKHTDDSKPATLDAKMSALYEGKVKALEDLVKEKERFIQRLERDLEDCRSRGRK